MKRFGKGLTLEGGTGQETNDLTSSLHLGSEQGKKDDACLPNYNKALDYSPRKHVDGFRGQHQKDSVKGDCEKMAHERHGFRNNPR